VPRRPASVELLASLARVLRRRKIRWYVFGAQAAVVYGSARMTMDVDVTVSVPAEGVRPLVDDLLGAGFASRVDDLEAFFARSRVVPLVHERTRMPLDLVVARDSLERVFLERARSVDVGGLKVPMITPEDLVIAKLFAARPRDLEDVRAVLGAQGSAMDLRHVRSVLGQLDEAEDRAELLPALERLLRETGSDD
jgi:predicted nucleotidyltransferase